MSASAYLSSRRIELCEVASNSLGLTTKLSRPLKHDIDHVLI